MNNYRTSRKIILTGATIIRVLFLLISFMAVASYLIWINHTKLIDRADEYMTQRYVERHSLKIDTANKLLKNSEPSKALTALKKAISEMGNVNKQDRLAPLYARALKLSLHANRQLRDLNASLETAKRQVEFNENNYNYWGEYSAELEASGKSKEALDAFYRAYKIAPYQPETAGPLSKYLYSVSMFQEADKIVEAYNNKVHIGVFQFYWAADGEDFSAKRRRHTDALLFDPGEPLKIVFSVNDNNIKRFKLNFAFVFSISVEIISITANTDEGRIDIDLTGVKKPGVHNMIMSEPYKFTLTGYDPHIFFDLPQALNVKSLEVSYKFIRKPLSLAGAF